MPFITIGPLNPTPLTVWFNPRNGYLNTCVGYNRANARELTIEELIMLSAKRGGV